jgi:H+/Cl- antiporter ClcA
MLLAVVGGALGLVCASLMQFISFFDHQLPIVFRTGFGFRLTGAIIVKPCCSR